MELAKCYSLFVDSLTFIHEYTIDEYANNELFGFTLCHFPNSPHILWSLPFSETHDRYKLIGHLRRHLVLETTLAIHICLEKNHNFLR